MKKMMGGDTSALFDYLKQSDSQFASFAESMQGKTPEQAFSEHGLDFSQFSNLM